MQISLQFRVQSSEERVHWVLGILPNTHKWRNSPIACRFCRCYNHSCIMLELECTFYNVEPPRIAPHCMHLIALPADTWPLDAVGNGNSRDWSIWNSRWPYWEVITGELFGSKSSHLKSQMDQHLDLVASFVGDSPMESFVLAKWRTINGDLHWNFSSMKNW